jgi:hypothetical protein
MIGWEALTRVKGEAEVSPLVSDKVVVVDDHLLDAEVTRYAKRHIELYEDRLKDREGVVVGVVEELVSESGGRLLEGGGALTESDERDLYVCHLGPGPGRWDLSPLGRERAPYHRALGTGCRAQGAGRRAQGTALLRQLPPLSSGVRRAQSTRLRRAPCVALSPAEGKGGIKREPS